MEIIKVFYDLETTGLNSKKHSIHRIAGIIEINDEVVEMFDIKVRPHPRAEFDEGALRVCGKTRDELLSYPSMKESLREYKGILGKYIDPFNPKQKAWNVGYDIRRFDDNFLTKWFELCGDNFIMSWFWPDTIDVLVLASQHLIQRRAGMPSFKLSVVAKELGLLIDEDRIHEAGYDVHLTREVYRIVTGLQIEM